MTSVGMLRAGLFVLLGGPILFVLHRIGLFLLNPVGGGEFHLIFAYSEGGRVGTAIWVLGESLVLALVLALLVRLVRIPVPWWLVAGVMTAIVLIHWWSIMTFPYAGRSFRLATASLTPIVPGILIKVLFGLERRRRAKVRVAA